MTFFARRCSNSYTLSVRSSINKDTQFQISISNLKIHKLLLMIHNWCYITR